MSDLFAGIEVATVVTGRSTIGSQIEEAWNYWVELTGRPDKGKVHDKFRSEYKRMLDSNFAHGDNLKIIEAAARLEPRPRDPHDVRRVIMPLTDYNHERTAFALLAADSPIVPYPRPDTNVTLSNISDLEEACETDKKMWTENDLAAAGILITELTPKELRHVADRVSLHVDSERILPTDMLRHYKAVGKEQLTAKAKASRNSYTAGRKESDTIKEVQFIADLAAEKMMLKGIAPQEIVQFHNLAPQGYWDSVIEVLSSNPAALHKEVYKDLEAEYDWNPSDRNKKAGIS